jgi:hypothetical protein
VTTLLVDPVVVLPHDEPTDLGVQLGERQRGRGHRFAVIAGWDVTGQRGQQLGGDGAEQAFDLAASAGLGSSGRCNT